MQYVCYMWYFVLATSLAVLLQNTRSLWGRANLHTYVLGRALSTRLCMCINPDYIWDSHGRVICISQRHLSVSLPGDAFFQCNFGEHFGVPSSCEYNFQIMCIGLVTVQSSHRHSLSLQEWLHNTYRHFTHVGDALRHIELASALYCGLAYQPLLP